MRTGKNHAAETALLPFGALRAKLLLALLAGYATCLVGIGLLGS